MTAQPKENNAMTPSEYLELERNSFNMKHEYFDGEVFAMVGAKKNHVYINLNIAAALQTN